MPDIAAIGWLAATIPYFVAITDRPGMGSGLTLFGAGAFWAITAIPISANASIARIEVLRKLDMVTRMVFWSLVVDTHLLNLHCVRSRRRWSSPLTALSVVSFRAKSRNLHSPDAHTTR